MMNALRPEPLRIPAFLARVFADGVVRMDVVMDVARERRQVLWAHAALRSAHGARLHALFVRLQAPLLLLLEGLFGLLARFRLGLRFGLGLRDHRLLLGRLPLRLRGLLPAPDSHL